MKKIVFVMILLVSAGAYAKDIKQCFFSEKPDAKEYGFKFSFSKKNSIESFVKKLEEKETLVKVERNNVFVSHPTREESSEDCFIAIKEKGLKKIEKTFIKE